MYKSITRNPKDLNLYFKSGCIICKSLSYICEYIFISLGFLTNTLVEIDDIHTYNSIKIGENVYFMDLQLDLKRIQLNIAPKYLLYSATQNMSNTCNSSILSLSLFYNNDSLKKSLKDTKNARQVLRDVTQNIYPKFIFPGYIERTGVYKEILFDIFSVSNLYTKLHFCTCYDSTTKKYVSVISYDFISTIYYIFDDSLYKYVYIDKENISNMLKSNLKILSGGIILNGKIITKNSKF